MLVWACRSDDITSRTTEYGMQFSSLSYRLKPVSCSLVACYSAHAIFRASFSFLVVDQSTIHDSASNSINALNPGRHGV